LTPLTEVWTWSYFCEAAIHLGTALEKMMVFFDESVTESVAKELSQVLQSFARPEIRMEIRTYMEDMLKKIMCVPED